MDIKLIVDSASDMVPEEAEAMGVKLLPMEITFEDGTYKDGFELTHRQFFEKLIECGDIPKTSQISEYVFDEAIKEALESCDGALIITMSGKLSGTYGQAVKAAEGMSKDINGVMQDLAKDMTTALPTDFSVKGSMENAMTSAVSGGAGKSGFVLQLNIDTFNNYTNEDIRQLTNEIMVTAGQFAKRKGVVFA